MGVGLRVDRAREAIERIATNAGAVGGGAAVRVLIQLNAQRQMERVQSLALQDIAQTLDARLVLDRRISVRGTGPRLGGILSTLTVHVVEHFGLQ